MIFKLSFLFIFLYSLNHTANHTINESELIGVWEVQSVSRMDNSPVNKVNKDFYQSALFNFKPDSRYLFRPGENANLQTKRVPSSYNNWLLKQGKLKIGNILNGYASNRIVIESENEKVIFKISDFKLEVKKISSQEITETKRSDFINNWLSYLIATKDESFNRTIDESNTYMIEEVDQLPIFKGCDDNSNKDQQIQCLSYYLADYINMNLNISKIARKSNVSGKVVRFEINFIIDSEGELSNIYLKGATETAIVETFKILRKIKQAKPALINSKPVNLAVRLPISFKSM